MQLKLLKLRVDHEIIIYIMMLKLSKMYLHYLHDYNNNNRENNSNRRHRYWWASVRTPVFGCFWFRKLQIRPPMHPLVLN